MQRLEETQQHSIMKNNGIDCPVSKKCIFALKKQSDNATVFQ